MRTFTSIAFIALVTLIAASSMGCAQEDDNCGQTSGCNPPPETCGDDACQANEGENAQNCPEDCVPATCGDGTCSAADGETEQNCEADCNVTCVSDPQLPVYCADTNSCWPAGTDCSLPTYSCSGYLDDNRATTGRCLPEQAEDQIDSQIACCDGVYYDCPSNYPQFCPDGRGCVREGECPIAATQCEIPRLDCRTP
jgi:hypothetical protein